MKAPTWREPNIAYPAMWTVPDAVTFADVDEFTRTYSRPNGSRGAIGLYQSSFEGSILF